MNGSRRVVKIGSAQALDISNKQMTPADAHRVGGRGLAALARPVYILEMSEVSRTVRGVGKI